MGVSGFDRINSAPYDISLNSVPFVIAEVFDNQGRPTGKIQWSQKRIKFTPGAQPSPSAEPYTIEPELEIPQVFSLWRNGIGIRQQPDIPSKDPNGIYYGRFIDKAGPYLAPSAAVTVVTPGTTDTDNGGNEFFEFPIGGTAVSSTATGAGSTTTLVDAGATWAVNQFAGCYLSITGGTDSGSSAVIISNTATILTFSPAFAGATDNTSVYNIKRAPNTPFLVNNASQQTGAFAAAIVSSGGTLAAGAYQIKVTWVNGQAETLASSALTLTTVNAVSKIVILPPTTVPLGAIAWYAYVTAVGGSSFTRQQTLGSPTSITYDGSHAYTISSAPATTGSQPPSAPSPCHLLVCAMGRYLLYYADAGFAPNNATTPVNSWLNATGLSLGSKSKITGLAAYRGQQTNVFLYIAWQNSSSVAQNHYVWDGTNAAGVFTQITNDGNSVAPAAVDFVTYRDEIWMLSQDSTGRWQVQKDNTGVTVSSTSDLMSGGTVICDGSDVCDKIAVNQDRLFIRSTKGLLAVNAAEVDAQQITGDSFKYQYSTLNECHPVAFGQFLITSISGTFFAYDCQSGSVNEIGIGVLKNNDSGVAAGTHTCAAPYKFLTLYTWTWNPANNTAYLWRWGEHEKIDTLYSPVPYDEFLTCLYGSLYEQSARVNGTAVTEIGGLTPRLLWVDTSGAITYMPLSRESANPYSDPAIPANTTANIAGTYTSEIYLPAITARNPAEVKTATAVVCVGRNQTSTNYWLFDYNPSPSTSVMLTNVMLTNGSNTLVCDSTSACAAGFAISGTGIPASTTIASVVDNRTLKLNNNATAAATGNYTVTTSFGNHANLDGGGIFVQTPSQRLDFGAAGQQPPTTAWLDSRIRIVNTSASAPPMLQSVVVYDVLRPIFKWSFAAVVELGAKVHAHNGASSGRLHDVLDDITALEAVAGNRGPVTLVTPYGASKQVFVNNISIESQMRDPNEPHVWMATIEMAEDRSTSVYVNGSYQHLNQWLYSYLNGFTYVGDSGL